MLAFALPIDSRAYPAPVARALAPVTAVALVAPTADPAERDFIASLAGRTVSALVIGRSDNGRALVDIGGRRIPVNAALPAAGAAVLLSFGDAQAVGLSAELPGGSAQAAATPPGLQAGLRAARELHEAARAAAPSALNDQSTRAGSLVELRPQALSLGRLADSPGQPLQLGRVAADIGQPAQWAQALGAMVRESGAFYESHLSAWTQGQYPLAQIRHEPQAAGHEPQAAGHEPQATGHKPQATGHEQQTPGQASQTADLLAPGTGPRTPAAIDRADAAPPAATDATGVPDALRAVVREQLHALETRALPFAVEVWPGQHADLVIGGEPEGPAGATAEPAWNTTLKLELPRLGNIAAVLTLSGDRLWLELTAMPTSADELDAASSSLSNAMQAAGVQMARVRVRDQAGGKTATGAP